MTQSFAFDNSFARLPNLFFARQQPEAASDPALLAFNRDLAQLLDLPDLSDAEAAALFGGNTLPDGAEPLAQLYAGHQFGNYNPQLGDGRAVLLGEVIGRDKQRYDIQLKGAGRTPFSRNGDGRAWLGPVLREYLVSEAMHALGIPTTRALAAVSTGDRVQRETALPGAVLTRVAASHLRVGSFQIFAARGQIEALEQLTTYAISRHSPQAEGPMGLLQAVCEAQAQLVARWMSVGFIHGVMNTDNCTISGETIDYGPCAFMDSYHPNTVYSSIDQFGRYAYANQPGIVVWNLAQLATALIQQMPDKQTAVEQATEIVHAVPDRIDALWLERFGAKIGLSAPKAEDQALLTDLLARMAAEQADFTNTFRALAEGTARDQFTDPGAFDSWAQGWQARLSTEPDPKALMRATNPWIIPRNHRVEQMIEAALEGDFAPFARLSDALSKPFTPLPEMQDLTRPPAENERVAATFCGT